MCMLLIAAFSHFFALQYHIGIQADFWPQQYFSITANSASKEANFYESQWIALKLKYMLPLLEKLMLYQSHIPNQAESIGKYDF